MIIYVKNSQRIKKNLQQQISNYSKIAEYKVNIQKSIPYLYTINEQEEFEIKDTMPFTCASTKIKHACIYLTKYIQVLHEKNYKTNE